ncbi:MAG: hypothetical protein GY835_12755, partial [bacterium]|nr:hypothetical protein [bacterium]
LYPGTFAAAPALKKMMQLMLTRNEWESLPILQDEPAEASLSVAAMMPTETLEPGELTEPADDASVIARFVASQKQEEVVVDVVGKARPRNPMVDFQLLDFERRHQPRQKDLTYKGFSYGPPRFLPQSFLQQHYTGGADRRAAKMNPMGTKDAAFDCLLPHRMKKVGVTVQSVQSVMTPSGQQAPKLARVAVLPTMTDVDPEQALKMILPRNAPGFFPGMHRVSSQELWCSPMLETQEDSWSGIGR